MARYTNEQRAELLQRAKEYKNAKKASEELGVSYQTMLKWLKAEASGDSGSPAAEELPARSPDDAAATDASAAGEAENAAEKGAPAGKLRELLQGGPTAGYEKKVRALEGEVEALLKENATLRSALAILLK